MSPPLRSSLIAYPGFPRVSGDEPVSQAQAPSKRPFSPRERG